MTTERPKSASLISVSESIRSIGFGDSPPILRQNNCVRNTFRVLSDQSKPIRDTITIVLYCSAHDRILLSKYKTGEIYFPHYSILPGESPTESVVLVIERILRSFPKYFPAPKEIKLARIVSYPISDANRHVITHYTYFACVAHAPKFEDIPDPAVVKRGPMLTPPNGTFWNSEYELTYAWTQFTDFANLRNSFWGPEVQEQAHNIRMNNMRLKDLNLEVINYCLSSIEKFYTECTSPLYGVKDLRALIRHSRIDQQILTGLWNEWIFHCSPSIAMCYLSFKRFLHKLDIVPKNVSKREIEEFDKIVRRLYHAFISTGDNLRSLCRNVFSKGPSSSDIEVTDFRQVQAKSTLPQLDFLSLALGLAILDSGITSYIFWDVHMLFSFMYNSYKEGQVNNDEDCLTLNQLKDMIFETPDILNSAFVNKISQENSRIECVARAKPSIDDCAVILMKAIGRMDTVDDSSFLKLNDFRFSHDTGDTEEMIDLMWLLARTHFRLEEDGQILRRVQTQMMIRQNSGNSGKLSDLGNDDNDLSRNFSGDERIKLARTIITQNIERDRCEECSLVDYKISSKVTTMNRAGYPISFEPVDYPGIDDQKNLTSSDIPILFLASNMTANTNTIEMFANVMARKQDIKQVFKAAKAILLEQNDLIKSVECPAVVIGEVRGNHLSLTNICESVCPLFTHMTSTSFITCGNYFDDDSGLEALVFLLSAKIHSPERIILLKGPNDNRESIREMSLYKKSVEFFDSETWSLLFDCLDLLPFAAIVKDKIFVSKSGIPITSRKLSCITEFRRESSNLKKESLFFTQILSGQIVKNKSKRSKNSKLQASVTKSKSDETNKNKWSQVGSSNNNKSNDSPEITFEELEGFLKRNNLSHFVRSESFAPEENVKCFKVQFGCQMITLGSLQAHETPHTESFGRVNSAFLMISKSSLQLIKLSETIKQTPIGNELSQKGFLNARG